MSAVILSSLIAHGTPCASFRLRRAWMHSEFDKSELSNEYIEFFDQSASVRCSNHIARRLLLMTTSPIRIPSHTQRSLHIPYIKSVYIMDIYDKEIHLKSCL